MPITAINDTIVLAKQQESETGHLAKLLQAQVDNRQLHLSIQLPQQGAAEVLQQFVIAYIEHVPLFLEACRAITHDANISEHTEFFFQLAEDFFLKPPEIVNGQSGLIELMDEAYLAHRLMEEVNDRFMAKSGIALIPMDMTLSNLIIHSLIGEPFANELDEAVAFTVQRAMLKEHIYHSPAFVAYANLHRNNQWQQEHSHWPCLMDQLSINLQFAGSQPA